MVGSAFTLFLCACAAPSANTRDAAPALIFEASQAGRKTLDADRQGGNPFASAFVDALSRPDVTLGNLPFLLRDLTLRYSDGQQAPDVPRVAEPAHWALRTTDAAKIALVIVVSDYSQGGAPSLDGAKLDAQRVSGALQQAGFHTRTVVDPSIAAFRGELTEFSLASSHADISVLYATGHGAEVDGRVYLMMGDFPVHGGTTSMLAGHAIPLAEIAQAPRGKTANLVL